MEEDSPIVDAQFVPHIQGHIDSKECEVTQSLSAVRSPWHGRDGGWRTRVQHDAVERSECSPDPRLSRKVQDLADAFKRAIAQANSALTQLQDKLRVIGNIQDDLVGGNTQDPATGPNLVTGRRMLTSESGTLPRAEDLPEKMRASNSPMMPSSTQEPSHSQWGMQERSTATQNSLPQQSPREQIQSSTDPSHQCSERFCCEGTSSDSSSQPYEEDHWDESIKELVATGRLLQAPLPTFTGGSCEEYWEFMRFFQYYVDDTQVPESCKLQALLGACTGNIKTILQSCVEGDPGESYKRAKAILHDRYSDDQAYVNQLMATVTEGPPVKDNDAEALQQLVDDILDCMCELDVLGRGQEISSQHCMAAIAKRLPRKMQDRCGDESYEFWKRHDFYPDIMWMKEFLQHEINRIIGEEGDKISKQPLTATYSRSVRGQIRTAEEVPKRGRYKRLTCALCSETHDLSRCRTFHNMTVRGRRQTVRRLHCCYLCLSDTHLVAECGSRTLCSVEGCSGKHSKWIHLPEYSDGVRTGSRTELHLRETSNVALRSERPRRSSRRPTRDETPPDEIYAERDRSEDSLSVYASHRHKRRHREEEDLRREAEWDMRDEYRHKRFKCDGTRDGAHEHGETYSRYSV